MPALLAPAAPPAPLLPPLPEVPLAPPLDPLDPPLATSAAPPLPAAALFSAHAVLPALEPPTPPRPPPARAAAPATFPPAPTVPEAPPPRPAVTPLPAPELASCVGWWSEPHPPIVNAMPQISICSESLRMTFCTSIPRRVVFASHLARWLALVEDAAKVTGTPPISTVTYMVCSANPQRCPCMPMARSRRVRFS